MPPVVLLVLIFAAVVGGMSALYSIVAGKGNDRSRRLRGDVTVSESVTPTKSKRSLKTLIADKIFEPVGKLLSRPRDNFKNQKDLQMAGYHGNRPLTMFVGAKVSLALVLPVVFWLYRSLLDIPTKESIIAAGAMAFMGWRIPYFWLGRAIKRRQEKLRGDLPDCLDLMVVSVEAGLGLDSALLKISEKLGHRCGELAGELNLLHLEVQAGKPRHSALRAFAERTGVKEIRSLVAKMIQSETFGTSIARSLRIHSENMREKRRQRAEETAGKTVVKMLMPLVFFIFPCVFVVILGPAVIQAIEAMG